MRRSITRTVVRVLTVAAAVAAVAPQVAPGQGVQRSAAIASSDVLSQISMFNYRAGRKSALRLRPTPIVASGEGRVQVEYENGNARISAQVERLPPPATLGPYTTYVLWALTPDGRAANAGVLAGADGDKGEIETQYGASQFALIVTAEPHFAVSAPSTMIVLYNVADGVKGDESKVTSLTERADYSGLKRIAIDAKTRPAELVQAEYAVEIARAVGAAQYATRLFGTAETKLAAARSAWSGKRSDRKSAPSLAREAVVAGEDARRAAMVARAAAEEEASRQAAAEAAAAAERKRAEAEAEAERERSAAAAQAAAEAAAAAAQQRAAEAARADLLNRLNSALPTHESDRGLVSEIGGVQFATGTADLSSGARERLARFSGIVASYPDLKFVVEGHTDNVGSDATNKELSLRRAIAVRDYLIGQGVAASKIDVEGFGSSRPVGDNSTADGRARNRRVDIVISGGLLVSSTRGASTG
ncbi:MAG TPA: OmpA family protein [Gammaproteobacteria bacterium]|nr:OmpA family protein [Gammaproteobacteria bacterium]